MRERKRERGREREREGLLHIVFSVEVVFRVQNPMYIKGDTCENKKIK